MGAGFANVAPGWMMIAGLIVLMGAAQAQTGSAGEAVTLARPILACRTLSELLQWDNPGSDSASLQRTIAEGSCVNLPAGTAVTVAEGASISGNDYECLKLASADCVWAGAVSPPRSSR